MRLLKMPWMTALMPRPVRFTPGKDSWYPLYERLGGPRGQSGRVGKILPPSWFKPRIAQPTVSRYTPFTTGRRNVKVFSDNCYILHAKLKVLLIGAAKALSMGVCRGWLRNYSLYIVLSIERIEYPRV